MFCCQNLGWFKDFLSVSLLTNKENVLQCKSMILTIASFVSCSPEPPPQSPVGRNGFDTQSDVYKMLQDYEEPVSEPKQSGSFKYLQEILEAEDGGSDSCVFVFIMEQQMQVVPLNLMHIMQRNNCSITLMRINCENQKRRIHRYLAVNKR